MLKTSDNSIHFMMNISSCCTLNIENLMPELRSHVTQPNKWNSPNILQDLSSNQMPLLLVMLAPDPWFPFFLWKKFENPIPVYQSSPRANLALSEYVTISWKLMLSYIFLLIAPAESINQSIGLMLVQVCPLCPRLKKKPHPLPKP